MLLHQLLFALLLLTVAAPPAAAAAENNSISSFSAAKKLLLKKVYFDHPQTLYCQAIFTHKKQTELPAGFTTRKYRKRSARIEWEHVVPAENFGRTFAEWREGDKSCISSKGKSFSGRRCANKTNKKYRYMQADLYNLYPAIGAVNALRSNYNFSLLPGEQSDFGSCQMKISHHKAEPPPRSRGRIARSYLYMEWAYPNYSMSRQQRQLIKAWDKQYPVSKWECKRAQRIAEIQGNRNPFVSKKCQG